MTPDVDRTDKSREKEVEFPGLNVSQVEESRRLHGANVLTPPARVPWWTLYITKFEDPIIRVLLIAALIALVAGAVEGHYAEGVGIIIAVFLATTLGFINEYKAGKEFDILNRVSDDEPITVIRAGDFTSIRKRDLVVGDVLVLEQGEEIPADAEVLSSVSLQVSEASLTGESVPVTKRPRGEAAANEVGLAYPRHQLLRGTFVSGGHALARVTSVGDKSEIGKTAHAASEATDEETPLNRQLSQLGKVIGVGGFAIAAFIFVSLVIRAALQGEMSESGLLTNGNWYFLSVLFASLAVAISRIWLPVAYDAAEVVGHGLPQNSWLERQGFKPWLQAVSGGILLFAVGLGLGIAVGWLPSTPSGWIPLSTVLTLLRFFMVAVTIIVVAVPEGLPMSVTLSLAYSMRKMTAANNLVRRMHACETIGAATVICSDKTGTLTMNEMRVASVNFENMGGETGKDSPEWRLLAEAIGGNSTANLGEDGKGRLAVPLGNPTECALLMWLENSGTRYQQERGAFTLCGQLTFSTERKYMATIGKGGLKDGLTLHVKGAPEIVLSRCGMKRGPGGGLESINPEERERLLASLRAEQARGMRTLGFAYRMLDSEKESFEADEVRELVELDGLVWLGFFSIADPVRPEVPDAIRACARAGIQVKMVTGDNNATATEIAKQIGMLDTAKTADSPATVTGDEFMAMDDEKAARAVKALRIMSRAKPLAKQRLVNLLQRQGEVVAVTGDGSNDAPALNHADVGLSMGITGTSVAKEASDIILLDDSFASIVKAVMWGRSLYANIQKFILFQLTINVAALGVAVLGPFLGIKLPLTVTQMLWINLIMDTFAALALASEPPDWGLMNKPPRKADAFIVTPVMARQIFIVAGIFLAMFLILVLGFGATFPMDDVTVVGRRNLSVFFSVFVFLQFWNLFNARVLGTVRSALSGLRESRFFLLIAAVIVVGQILLTQFGGDVFRTSPLTFKEWLAIIAGTSVVLWVGEISRWMRRSRVSR